MMQQERPLLSQSKDQDYNALKNTENDDEQEEETEQLSLFEIAAILSTAFSYGCVNSTLFLITLPIECERIEKQLASPKSVSLGIFVAIAGLTQLITPLIGMLSDIYKPPANYELGQRLPYLVLGSILSTIGVLGQYFFSTSNFWFSYGVCFFFVMIGLTISYTMMITLIPDQVPKQQTGVANGILAFLLIGGSLFGFELFHLFFDKRIQDMYGLYICIIIMTTILTGLYAQDRDAALNHKRGVITSTAQTSRRHRRVRLILGPWMLVKTMFYDPLSALDSKALQSTYQIDISKNFNFFLVTISRLFYYCGVSIQTFFLYFLHDIIHVRKDPEAAVARLAILVQISGGIICYPVGIASDRLFGGQRKPFVYLACFILSGDMIGMIFASEMNHMMILCMILGAGNGMYLTTETSLAVDALPHSRTNVGDSGDVSGGDAQLLGIWGVAAFVGTTMGPMIGGPILYFLGSDPDNLKDGQDYSIEGYTVVLGLSAFYFFLSALALYWVKK